MNALDRQAVLITQNVKDFKLLQSAWRLWAARWAAADQHHGIIGLPTTGQKWTEVEWMPEIRWLLANRQPFTNEMFEWNSGQGWRTVPS